MAGYDVVPSPSYPTPNYQALGSTLANLFTTNQNSQQNANALQQQKMKLQQQQAAEAVPPLLPNGQPNYAGVMGALLKAGDAGALERLGPLATEAQGGTPSALFTGAQIPAPGPGVGATPAPPQPTGDVPPASAANSSATRPQTAPNITSGAIPVLRPAAPTPGGVGNSGATLAPANLGNLTGVSSSGTTIAELAGKAIGDPQKSAQVAGLIARGVGADPNAPLTPDQAARVQKALASYSQRNPGVAATGKLPINLRDNNPGNLVDSAWTERQPGFVGTDGRYAKFDTPEDGYRAANANLDSYAERGIQTPEAILAKWAPTGDGGNNPAAYAATAAQHGVTPGQPVGADPASRAKLLEAMTAVEGGRPSPYSPEQIQSFLKGQGGAPAAGGGQPIVPQVPLPRGYTDPQRAIQAIDQEAARLAASPNPADRRQIPILQDWRDRIAKSTEPMKVTPTETIIDPATGAIRYQGPFAGGQGMMTPESIEGAAQAWVTSGDLPKNMGRGVQGAATMNAIINRGYQIADEQGIDPSTLPQRWQSFKSSAAGKTLLEKRTASLELAENEANALIPAVRDAAAKVSSTQYPDINKVIQAGLMHTGNADVVRLGIAVESLAQTYARVLSPSGAPTAADKANAHEIIAKYWSQGQIDAALEQMETEIARAKQSLNTTRLEMGESPLKEDSRKAAPATAAPAPKSGPLPPGTYNYDPKTGELLGSQ
jgi:hypothetical protein